MPIEEAKHLIVEIADWMEEQEAVKREPVKLPAGQLKPQNEGEHRGAC